ncbi:MAG: hypothetical protein ATN31_05020 [Candidatus Epulonipiscioides saccharophilum]|nr:MAG: hypothetical protein ATN31_05020 [Epulopiscium sp. AS2M-Bin001]
MNNLNETMQFTFDLTEQVSTREILLEVYSDLQSRGYNPINQIVGYIMSGDPTYITSYNGARTKIRKLERDEILEELVASYVGEKN